MPNELRQTSSGPVTTISQDRSRGQIEKENSQLASFAGEFTITDVRFTAPISK